MNVRLKCSDSLRPIVIELLKNREINVNDDSDILLIQKGLDLDDGVISIVFDMNTLDKLMEFLDRLTSKQENSQVLSGKSDTGYEILSYSDICYFEGMGNNVYAVNNDKKFRVKEKLYELEPKLRSEGFIRVSKAFIVNIVKIDKINPWFNGKLLLKMAEPDIEIDVTRKYVKDFKSFLGL